MKSFCSATHGCAIRQATAADFGDILRLNDEWVHFTSALDEQSLDALHAKSTYHRVAERHGQVIAFLLALREGADYASPNYRWFDERGGEFLYIDRVVVARDEHGSGVAAMLYDDLFAFARSAGIARVVCELDLEPLNEASRRFHEARGFIEVGTQWIAGGAKRVSLREAEIASG
ncbi:MAG: GNAT family N-acetyltransferase [Coriobacteriia bacterium]|nr:GNAT family N-acetyltransferase [Coriobacteriia bacterium]